MQPKLLNHLYTNISLSSLQKTKIKGMKMKLKILAANCICEFCGAIICCKERTLKSNPVKNPKFYFCCLEGRVQLPLLKDPPEFLKNLLMQNSARFQDNIRLCNSMCAFTSMGGNIDHKINNGSGPYVFRLNGYTYHRIGSLLPILDKKPGFAQLYVYDTRT